jgi:hypothetical protein
VSKALNGAQPTPDLSYDLGAGTGTFGVGWKFNVGSVKRSTAKRVPTDTFVLSNTDDLVPDERPILTPRSNAALGTAQRPGYA